MSGGKGGSETSEVKIPQYIEDASKQNIGAAQNIAKLGYMPYYGPDVAAATPQQIASWRGTNDMASAFGMQGGNVSLPQAQDFGGGVSGYSSAPMMQMALAELRKRDPEQMKRYDGIFSGMTAQKPPTPVPPAPNLPGNGDSPGNGLIDLVRRMRGGLS